MKKMILAVIGLCITILSTSGMAEATYIQTNNIYQYSVGGKVNWAHTYDFSEMSPINFATLTIVADDVDYGEFDYVILNGVSLGALTQLPSYTNWAYTPGVGGDTTTTVFNIDASLLDWSMPISVSVASNWGAEIETSTLTVQGSTAPVPEPGTIALLGLGMAGLAVYGKRRQKKA